MLVTLGDLVEDVVVRLDGAINVASDTAASITHRRGGSAANVAVVAAGLGAPTRFVGQVGDDAVGRALVEELADAGVDVSYVRRAGETATIVVLVDGAGERSMLVDRGSARELTGAEPAWLDGARVLHLTLYSLLDEPIATTSREVVDLAHARGIAVSVDVSSTALIEAFGGRAALRLVTSLGPSVLFANADEARVLGLTDSDAELSVETVVIKRGPAPCTVLRRGSGPVEVPAIPLDAVVDTTGAGDAFAAGVLTFPGWQDELVGAVEAGHRAAHRLLSDRLASG